MILSDLNKVKIEDVIEEMKGEQFFALLLGDDEWAVFISLEFLNGFESTDGVCVAGLELCEYWGEARIGTRPYRKQFTFFNCAGTNLFDLGFRCVLCPNMGTVAAELKNALNFERYGKILAYTGAEVLEMSGEDDK